MFRYRHRLYYYMGNSGAVHLNAEKGKKDKGKRKLLIVRRPEKIHRKVI